MPEGFSSIRSGITVAYPDAECTIEQARLAEDVSNPARWSLRVTNCRQLIDSGRVSRSKYCAYFSILIGDRNAALPGVTVRVTAVWTLTKQNGFCESSRVVTS